MWLHRWDPRGQLSDVNAEIAVAMWHGEQWTNSRVRDRVRPLDSTVARVELQGLVAAGLATVQGERGQTPTPLADTLNIEITGTDAPRITVPLQRRLGSDPADPETDRGPSPDVSVTKFAPHHLDGTGRGSDDLHAPRPSTGLHAHSASLPPGDQDWSGLAGSPLTEVGDAGVRRTHDVLAKLPRRVTRVAAVSAPTTRHTV